MPKNALVILGAGASSGLAVAGQNIPQPEYTPPITKEIFTGAYAGTNLHLRHYPRAEQLANRLRVKLKTDPESLEVEMRNLRDSPEPDTARSFLEMPIFFQELFGEISARYSTSNGNYDALVLALLESDFDKIAFVTLNYDLFLDRTLATLAGLSDGIFPNIRSYITTGDRWMLIKLHGSVSWMRPVLRPVDGPGGSVDAKRRRLLTLLDEIGRFSGKKELRVAEWDDWFTKTDGGWQAHYPHLAVPIKDKTDPVCPQQHLDALQEFLPTCRNVLAIGVSGRDLDLFEQMVSLPDCANFYVVAKSESKGNQVANAIEPKSEANKIADRFIGYVPQLQHGWHSSNAFDGGFLDFQSVDRGLDKFIAAARE